MIELIAEVAVYAAIIGLVVVVGSRRRPMACFVSTKRTR